MMTSLNRMKLRTVLKRGGALLAAGLILTSCGWKGISNVPVPGGAGTGARRALRRRHRLRRLRAVSDLLL